MYRVAGFSPCDTARNKQEQLIDHDASARADCAEVIDARSEEVIHGAARFREETGIRIQVGPVPISLNAEDGAALLHVVANLSARREAVVSGGEASRNSRDGTVEVVLVGGQRRPSDVASDVEAAEVGATRNRDNPTPLVTVSGCVDRNGRHSGYRRQGTDTARNPIVPLYDYRPR